MIKKEERMIYKPLNKILCAVDGSDQSLNAVRYAANVLAADKTEVTIFHVDTEVPEAFWDMEKNPHFSSQITSMRSWLAYQKNMMRQYMDHAKHIFIQAGFPEERVTIRMESRKVGVARDILHESMNDYSAVFVGRTGSSNFKNFLIGSVATKLAGKLVSTPLVVVGGNPETQKFLVAFDGSEGSKKAIHCASSLLQHADCQIKLCHVIRSVGNVRQKYEEMSNPNFVGDWLQGCRERIKPDIEKAVELLIDEGFDEKNISAEILTEKPSRAGAVVEKAEMENYGSIIAGRRGMSIVEEFFMGRVGKKILDMALEKAVWIVS